MNAGKNNYTRFNRDYKAVMKSGTLNMQWCASFVSCLFLYEFGLEAAKALLCKTLYCYTPTGASYFKKADRYVKRGKGRPQPGDVVFFYSAAKKRIGHVGLVTKVTDAKVYTIEGNTSGASKLITNGGGVCAKSYSLTSTYIDGYGRPPYGEVDGTPMDEAPAEWALGARLIKKGAVGDDVKALQEVLIGWAYDLGSYGADGEYGKMTAAAVARFQRESGLDDDGEYGPLTHAALTKRLATGEEPSKDSQPIDDDANEGLPPAEDLPPAEELPPAEDDRAIIDISVYQTIKDAGAAAKVAAHVKLVIHRASIGLKADAKWAKHARLMQGAGIAYGAYHYVKATNAAEARAEAGVFWASAQAFDPVFYVADMEWNGIAKGRACNICSAFIGELKRLGAQRTGIYVGHHLYKLWNLNYDEVDFTWIPRYGTKKENLAGKPGKWPAYPCTLHQYTSCGRIPGITGRVDMNRMTGKQLSFEQLTKRRQV